MKHHTPKTQKTDKVNKGKKIKYRITNWKEYNQSLINRGSLTLWISDNVDRNWYAIQNGKPGSPKKYSDYSIETILTIQQIYQLPLRAIQGFTHSLFVFMHKTLDVPNYTTLSRRNPGLSVNLHKSDKKITDIVVDSTGVKVYGEGEWKVRKHGVSKRRTWKKIHIGIDEKGELRAVEVTDNDTHDSEVIPALLSQEMATVANFYADGAYDTRNVYQTLIGRDVHGVHIPPQKNAKIWQHGNSLQSPHPRDENLRQIRKATRRRWKQVSGYHKRSLSENTMFRLKTIFPPTLRFRRDRSQVNEVMYRANILNIFFGLGMPQTVAIN